MKSLEKLRRAVLHAALLGAGILVGLALGWSIFNFNLGSMGIAAIFANAIGAAIGAAITLEVAERRALQAEARAQAAASEQKRRQLVAVVADLSILAGNLGYLADQLEKGEVSGSTMTAWLAVEQRLADSASITRYFLDAGLVEHFTTLAMELPHIQRIVIDVRGGVVTKEEMLEGATGKTIGEELRKTERSIDAAKATLMTLKL